MRTRKSKKYPSNYKKPDPSHEVSETTDQKVNFYAPIAKADEDKRIVVGVVSEPDSTDAQGDIIPREVIEKAAHKFLSSYNVETTLGFAHKVFSKNFDLLESYLAPQDMTIGSQLVKAGSWVMAVKVLNDDIWKLVKNGSIKGFSIGGMMKSQPIKA